MDESPGEEVIDFILEQYTTKPVSEEEPTVSGNTDDIEIDDSAIRAFLNYVSGISTEFDAEALAMLKYYFIATRTIRPSKFFKTHFQYHRDHQDI